LSSFYFFILPLLLEKGFKHMQDLAGQQLGNYQLIQLLGRGGYAEVYLGKHVRLESQAAIKVLHTRLVSSEEIDRFQGEGRIIARLVHPHIIRVLDFDVQQDIPFMVMDYAPNGTLRKRHPKGEQLALPVILPYVKQVADALQYAHDQQYVHRDIKPENMLVGRNDEILLSDFGTALVSQATGYQNAVQEEVVGTVSYMAPEQFQGKARPASDQYALAIIVYAWLSGNVPFHGASTEVAIQHSIQPPPSLREKVPGLSPQVEQVIMRALAKDYHQRYPTIQEFALALEQASLSGSSIYAEPTVGVPVIAPGSQQHTPLAAPVMAPLRDEEQLSSHQTHPVMHSLYPPIKPAPLEMDTVTSEAAYASTPPTPRLPSPDPATPPQQQPYYQEQPQARHHGFERAVLLLLLILVLLVGGLTWYVVPHLAGNSTPTGLSPQPIPTTVAPQPTPTRVAPQPTPTTASPQPTPTEGSPQPTPTATSPQPTPTPASPQPTPTPASPQPTPTPASPQPTPTPAGVAPQSTPMGVLPQPTPTGSTQK
jgi:serine/threonine protein kinase